MDYISYVLHTQIIMFLVTGMSQPGLPTTTTAAHTTTRTRGTTTTVSSAITNIVASASAPTSTAPAIPNPNPNANTGTNFTPDRQHHPHSNVSLVNIITAITTALSPSHLNQQLKTFAPRELRDLIFVTGRTGSVERVGHAGEHARYTVYPVSCCWFCVPSCCVLDDAAVIAPQGCTLA